MRLESVLYGGESSNYVLGWLGVAPSFLLANGRSERGQAGKKVACFMFHWRSGYTWAVLLGNQTFSFSFPFFIILIIIITIARYFFCFLDCFAVAQTSNFLRPCFLDCVSTGARLGLRPTKRGPCSGALPAL